MQLQQISKEDAYKLITDKYLEEKMWWGSEELEYWAYPQSFGSTSGPFGGIGGQAFTTFTTEAWVFVNLAVLFCGSKVLRVTDKWEGPNSVRL